MQPVDEPHLREPRYARDQYYIELHGKWSQKTADLLAPTLKGRNATTTSAAAPYKSGGGSTESSSRPATNAPTTSRDLMAMHLENYQRALAGNNTTSHTSRQSGGDVGQNTSSSQQQSQQPPRSPPPRAITQVSTLNTSSRGAAQLEAQLQGTPQAVSQSPEIPASFPSSEKKMISKNKSDEMFSPMSVQAYEEQRKRIAERQQTLPVPVEIKHNPFQPRPQPASYDMMGSKRSSNNMNSRDQDAATAAAAATSQDDAAKQSPKDEFIRSPPKEKMATGENLLVKTPIVKMQAIQEKLALIANHQGALSRDELEVLLGDVESILVEEGADVPKRPTPTPKKKPTTTTPSRVNTGSSPIRAAASPPRAQTPPRSPPARVKPFTPTTPPRQKSPMKVVDSFTQATPPPDVDSAAATFPNSFVPRPSPMPKQPHLDHHGVQTTSTPPSLLPPTAPPPMVAQQQSAVASNEEQQQQAVALQQFWQTYAYYAAAYQAYASAAAGGSSGGSQQPAGGVFTPNPSAPSNTGSSQPRGRAESTGVAWGSEPRAYQVPENPSRNLDPRVKHRPETTNTPPPGGNSRSLSAARSASKKRRERYLTDEEKMKEVDAFFEANEFGYAPLSPEKNGFGRDTSSIYPPPAANTSSASLQPKYARQTVAARSRSEQRRRDQMKREEIKRRKAEEQHRMEREMRARERNHGPVMTAETQKDLMRSRPRWQ